MASTQEVEEEEAKKTNTACVRCESCVGEEEEDEQLVCKQSE